MKTSTIILVMALGMASSTVAMAQSGSGQAVPSPIGAHEVPNAPLPVATSLPGGIYQIQNVYLTCPDTLMIVDGRPVLHPCRYVKDLH